MFLKVFPITALPMTWHCTSRRLRKKNSACCRCRSDDNHRVYSEDQWSHDSNQRQCQSPRRWSDGVSCVLEHHKSFDSSVTRRLRSWSQYRLKKHPFGQFKKCLWEKKKKKREKTSIDIQYIHRATKSCVPDQTDIAKTLVYEKENWE